MLDEKLFNELKSFYEFVNDLNESDQGEMTRFSVLKVMPPDTMIYLEGDNPTYFAMVLEGKIRIYKTGGSGREITLYRFGSGEGCILTASCIIGNSTFPAYALCEENTRCELVPSELVKKFFSKYVSWQKYIFSLLSKRLNEVIEIIDEVAFRNLDYRIAEYLLKNSSGGIVEKTHGNIASELGTSREVVSRIIKDFENRNLISH
jgi:CRP/FNR family transcriptional regulator